MAIILVVDDEPAVLNVVSHALARRGHTVLTASTPREAISVGLERIPALAVLDLDLRDQEMDGLGVFTALRGTLVDLLGVVLTGRATLPYAFQSGLAGVTEFIEKPVIPEVFAHLVDDVLARETVAAPTASVRADSPTRPDFDDMIGRSAAMRQLFDATARAAALDCPIFILGETGTGKELVARSVHRRSRRCNGPFVAVNCAAVPVTLFEAEFFGHERGAFTGAAASRPGHFEQANGGTLFLDEIGDLSPEAQAKLLRVLDQGEVTRLGSPQPRAVDTRVVAATNVDLMGAIQDGTFRADLYWRLCAMTLSLPPVRDRGDDVDRLIDAALARIAAELGLPRPEVSAEARAVLRAHSWPGNVREIETRVMAALLRADGAVVLASHVALDRASPLSDESVSGSTDAGPPAGVTLPTWLAGETARAERRAIELALVACAGSRSLAAARLGIDPRTLYSKMRRYGVDASPASRPTLDSDS